MKKAIVFTVFLILMFAANASAAKLMWTKVADTPNCIILGYNVSWGAVEGVYPKHRNVGNVDFVDQIKNTFGLIGGETVYFVVTAYSSDKEGPQSNSANYVVSTGYTPPPDTVVIHPEIPGKVVITIEVIPVEVMPASE